jgi:hypothetical protein
MTIPTVVALKRCKRRDRSLVAYVVEAHRSESVFKYQRHEVELARSNALGRYFHFLAP